MGTSVLDTELEADFCFASTDSLVELWTSFFLITDESTLFFAKAGDDDEDPSLFPMVDLLFSTPDLVSVAIFLLSPSSSYPANNNLLKFFLFKPEKKSANLITFGMKS